MVKFNRTKKKEHFKLNMDKYFENNSYTPFTFILKVAAIYKENKDKINKKSLGLSILLFALNYALLLPLLITIPLIGYYDFHYMSNDFWIFANKMIILNTVFAFLFFIFYTLNSFFFNILINKTISENKIKIINRFKNTFKQLFWLDNVLALLYFIVPISYLAANIGTRDNTNIGIELLLMVFVPIVIIWLLKFLLFDLNLNIKTFKYEIEENEFITKHNLFAIVIMTIQLLWFVMIILFTSTLVFYNIMFDEAFINGIISMHPISIWAIYWGIIIPISILMFCLIKVLAKYFILKNEPISKKYKIFLIIMPCWIRITK
ncbi:hypothetical protein ACJA25_01835 [Mycoplasmopsis hyopharyngis]|uniref:hypothetical protein n=1 Tax=Mycoplasmopsis hyopharyngis TaxID=29558 RepID=UPI0038739A17